MADAKEHSNRINDLPCAAEYAKSSRSMCRKCREKISSGALRMSVRLQSQHFDGLQDNWYHYDCFWKKLKNRNAINKASIHGLDWLQWDDQEKIRAKIEGTDDEPTNEEDAPKATGVKLEYAKTNRGKCTLCSANIEKSTLKVVRSSQGHHIDCFISSYAPSCIYAGKADQFTGYDDISEEDKAKLLKAFEKKDTRKRESVDVPTNSGSSAKKIKDESDVDRELLKDQSIALHDMMQNLKTSVHKSFWKKLLLDNGQEVPESGDDKIIQRLADGMIFGALKPCPMCHGQLVYSSSNQTYLCSKKTDWTTCEYSNKKPDRKPFVISDECRQIEWLASLPSILPHLPQRYYAPLTESPLKSAANVFPPIARRTGVIDRGSGLKSGHGRSSGKQKLVIKNGAAVDTECEYADVCHVYRDREGEHWDVVLNKVDVAEGKNSYYKIQLLEHDKSSKYYLFRSWGRIGTDIGGSKTEQCDLETGMTIFRGHYVEKSGNQWEDRHRFVKQPGKMYPVEIDYSLEANLATSSQVKPGSKSTLPVEIQQIIQMIFDVNNMKEAMKEFEIDTEKMPLGKLSKKQIHLAYGVLSELQNLIAGNHTSNDIIAATNRFYTIIPHNFGIKRDAIPMLDNTEIITKKTEMLDSLLEIELAYSILKSEAEQEESIGNRDPIDVHYEKLNTNMEVLDKNSDEFKRILQYVENTHAPTHMINLKVKDVIKIERSGESKRFEKFNKLKNHQLLWHGSRVTNYAGILSQGLRIAPPEAPSTGYMFGKGVYFADLATKSANYCFANNTDGLMLLCEVALGEMQEETHAKQIEKLKKGKHSCKGLGRTMPDPKSTVVLDDELIVPLGKPVDSGRRDLTLLYNEYIVYDVAQVKIKYLLRMEFKVKQV